MSTALVLWGLGIYIVVGTAIAWMARHRVGVGMSEYFLAGRKLGGLVAALTYSATTYSAFMLIGLAGLTYQGGVGALGFELIYLAGLSLVVFFGPRFWRVGHAYDYVTPAEMLGDRYESRLVAVVVAVVSCIFLIPYSAVQLMGIGYLLEGLTEGGVSFIAGVTVAAVLAVAWAYLAGLRSVAWTDSLQSLVMIVSAVAVLVLVVRALGGPGAFAATLERDHAEWLTVPGPGYFDLPTFIGLSLPWFFFSISNPQVSQRLFVPASLASMRVMVLGFLVFGFVYTLVSIVWGFSALVMFPGLENPDLATPTLLSSGVVPPLLALMVMLGITAAAISTVDSILLTLSSMVSRDLYGNLRRDGTEQRQLLAARLVIPFIAVLAFLFARLRLDLIAVLSVASSAGLLVMVPTIIGAFYWRRGSAAGAMLSIVTGAVVVMVTQFGGWRPLGQWPGVWGLATATAVFVGVSLATRPAAEGAGKFEAVLGG
ncbi:MAG: sodium:solute symporter family protein [Gemmatimonadota bacterium]